MDVEESTPRTMLRIPNRPGGSSQLRRFLTLRVTVPFFYPHVMSVLEANAPLRSLATTIENTCGGRAGRLEGTSGR